MKNTMTYAQALNVAIENSTNPIVIERLTALSERLAKRSSRSDEAKAKANTKRKEKNAAERAEMLSVVVPILRNQMTTIADNAMTAKEIFTACENYLPEGFTANKVQYILLHDMPEVRKVEVKGKPNGYFREV